MKKNLLSGQFALVVLVLAVVAVDVQMLTVARHTLAPLPAVLAVSALVAAALYLPLRRMWRRLVGGGRVDCFRGCCRGRRLAVVGCIS